MLNKSCLLLAGAVFMAACATPPRFEYGAYEPTLYAYYKKPEMADKFETALEKAIDRGEASGRLAPGLYAELGYLRLLQGDQTAAIALFQKEAEAFPESGFFMGTIVRRLNGEEMPAETIGQLRDKTAAADSSEALDPGTETESEGAAASDTLVTEAEEVEGEV